MTASVEDLIKLYPARQSQIDLLFDLFAHDDEPIPTTLFVHGCSSVGKSTILAATLKACDIRCAAVNLIECYTAKILFETILNKLSGHVIDPARGQPYAKCDTMMDFLFNLEKCSRERDLDRSAIILDKAERLRDMDANLLAGFLRLHELCSGGALSPSLCVIFISELPFSKYYYRGNIVEPIIIHFPQYNMKELIEILSLDYDSAMEIIRNNHEGTINIDVDFYKNYLNVFLSVFYRNCRDLKELKYMSRINFLNYCKPIISGKCNVTDAIALWKNISPILKSSLDNLYLRISSKSDQSGITFSKKNLADSIELPFYAKYLLIAAYLASYNSAGDDKRLFVKYHGKKRKTMKDVKAKNKVSEQLSTQSGPKAFTFDRLIAIFYAILNDKVSFNNNLLAQVSSLVELQLLSAATDGCNLDGQKYKCTVGFDFIQTISKQVDFNIRKYLSDFSHM